MGLLQEVSGLHTEVSENETKYHLLQCQLHITDQNIKKVTSGPAAERLRDRCVSRMAADRPPPLLAPMGAVALPPPAAPAA